MISPNTAAFALWTTWLVGWIAAARFTARTIFRLPPAARIAYSAPMLIGAFLLFGKHTRRGVLAHFVIPPSPVMAWTGVALIAIGVLYSGWARIHLGRFWSGTVTLKADHALIRTGPYAVTRHPIYTGLLIAVVGTAGLQDSIGALSGVALVLAGLLLKIHQEERLLTTHFGADYDAYRVKVPALIPGFHTKR